MKPTQDVIYIVSRSHTRAGAYRQVIDLRGVDEIVTLPFESVMAQILKKPPVLVILDTEAEDIPTALQLLTQLPSNIKRIMLADAFDEEVFLSAYDRGARDFLIKPVPNAYLVATLIRLLQERRQEQLLQQKDNILEDLGVLSRTTGVFTTSHLLKAIEAAFSNWQQQANDSLCLLTIQIDGLQYDPSNAAIQAAFADIARIIKDCARDSDLVGELFVSKFAVLLPHTAIRGARALAKRLTERIMQAHLKGPDGPLDIQVLVGIADATDCPHYEALLERSLNDLRQHTVVSANNIHII